MASSPHPARVQEIPRVVISERSQKKYLGVIAGVVIVAIVASVAYVWIAHSGREPRSESIPAARAVYPDPSTIGLSGSRVGRDIQITWNGHSSSFSDVRIGILTIKDGGSQREIALTAPELKARKLIYTPIADRVEASLELFSPDRKSTRESVLFVLEPRQDRALPLIAERTPAPVQQNAIEPEDAQTRSRAQSPAPAVRGFTPPAPQQPETRRVVMIEPPPAVETASASSLPPSVVQLPTAPAWRTPPPRQELQSPQVAPSKFRRPTRQVLAELPPNVLAMLKAPVEVDVRARVDASGKVVNAESLASASVLNRYLGTAAVVAARLWRFEPGHESTVTLKFKFEPR